MKKLILLAAITVAGFTAANAQVTFGVKAGLNIANLTGDLEGTSSLASFNAGALVNIPVSSMFSVQPEVLYSGEGAKVDGGKYQFNYINIPVLFQYNNPTGFIAEVGPQIGLLTSAKAKADGGGSTDVKDYLKSTNFSAVVGVGYKLAMGLGFNARYNIGLSNISDEDGGTIKTGTFAVGAFWAFGTKKAK